MSAGDSWSRSLHKAADRLDRKFGERLRRIPLLRDAWVNVLDRIVARQADRRYMQRKILPALARLRPARALFVGVRGYTRYYGRAFHGVRTEFWTCDIDPEAARHGAPARHLTEDVRAIDSAFPSGFFDVVLLNGVFGWGVDDTADMERTLRAVEHVLVPGGTLLIGWNSDRAPDPDTLPGIDLFEPGGIADLPARKSFADVTHVYAWYRAHIR